MDEAKLEEVRNAIQENLKTNYNLTENKGQICIEWLHTKIYVQNFAILENYFTFFPLYMAIREIIHVNLEKLFELENMTPKEAEDIDKELTPAITQLLYIGIDHKKTDLDILIRKMNNHPKNEDHAKFLFDIIQTFDWAIYRGQYLMGLMRTALKSGDVSQINELNEKNILPYDLVVGNSREEVANKMDQLKKERAKEPDSTNIYDLEKMKVIGEA